MKLDGELTVRITRSKGLGVFAVQKFKTGELVVRGIPISKTGIRTTHSFQIGFNEHVELDEPARLINHSCNPNLGIRNNKFGGYDFLALQDINLGEELGWDYCTTEYISIAVEDKCLCDSENCRTIISGYLTLPKEIKRKYGNFIADYLKK